MNRAQRRAVARQTPLRALDDDVRARQAELLEQARAICAVLPYPGETIADTVINLSSSIEDLADPQYGLVAGPALEVLRTARDNLAADLRAGVA